MILWVRWLQSERIEWFDWDWNIERLMDFFFAQLSKSMFVVERLKLANLQLFMFGRQKKSKSILGVIECLS